MKWFRKENHFGLGLLFKFFFNFKKQYIYQQIHTCWNDVIFTHTAYAYSQNWTWKFYKLFFLSLFYAQCPFALHFPFSIELWNRILIPLMVFVTYKTVNWTVISSRFILCRIDLCVRQKLKCSSSIEPRERELLRISLSIIWIIYISLVMPMRGLLGKLCPYWFYCHVLLLNLVRQ